MIGGPSVPPHMGPSGPSPQREPTWGAGPSARPTHPRRAITLHNPTEQRPCWPRLSAASLEGGSAGACADLSSSDAKLTSASFPQN